MPANLMPASGQPWLKIQWPIALRRRNHGEAAGHSRVTLAGLIIAFCGVAFMFGGHPVVAAMLLLLACMLVMLDEDMKSG
jgi:hypothetical protein